MPDRLRQGLSLYLLLGSLLWCSCANIVSPTGGPVDREAPKVVSEHPANGSINFTSRSITLCFDEYIQLKDAQKAVIFSPPLEFRPEVLAHGRCISIEFDRREKLKKDVTYTINMAGAVSDIHEGNPLIDYTYAFATGPFIDSLTIGGVVTQAFSLKKEAGYTVGLYGELDDSTLFNELPVYTGQTFANGQFRLRRVKTGTYHLAAFKDENNNVKLDPGEWVAFKSEPITVPDSIQFYNLTSWPVSTYSRNRIIDTLFPYRHVTELVFYRTEQSPVFKNGMLSRQTSVGDIDSVYVFDTREKKDSLIPISYSIGDKPYSFTVTNKARNLMPALLTVAFEYPDVVTLTSSTPIGLINPDSLTIMRDSLPLKKGQVAKINDFTLVFHLPESAPGQYKAIVGRGFITDMYNQLCEHSEQVFFIKPPENFGSIGLSIKNARKRSFLMQLTDEKENTLKTFNINSDTDIKLRWLNPGTYHIRFILDMNQNGKWDGGEIGMNRQPEKVFFFSTPILIRADWDIDNNIIDIEHFN